MKTEDMGLQIAYNLLKWAATPCNHGGNPYCRDDVQQAEIIVAAHEGRPVDGFAAEYIGGKRVN